MSTSPNFGLHLTSSNKIQLTRGDTARYTVDIINEVNGESYVMEPSDILRMTIKKSDRVKNALIEKSLIGSNMFLFSPEDTNGLSVGIYTYDVELTTSSGEVYTVIRPSTFEILSEVTW